MADYQPGVARRNRGRPRLPPEERRNREAISAQVPGTDKRLLERHADLRDTELSVLLREAIKMWLEANPIAGAERAAHNAAGNETLPLAADIQTAQPFRTQQEAS